MNYGIVDANIEEIKRLYLDNVSMNQLGILYGVNSALIRYHLIKHGIVLRTLKESVDKTIKNKSITSDYNLHQNILGWVLGDGSIRLGKKSVTPHFIYTDKKEEHIRYIESILNSYNIKTIINKNKHSDCFYLQTECLPFFRQYYDLFYGYDGLNENNQKRKILPDIVITPIILLNWFIGDGSVRKHEKLHSGQIACKYKNDYIAKQFDDLFGLVTYSRYQTKTGHCYTYYFNHPAYKHMLDYIGECPVSAYKYKWVIKH